MYLGISGANDSHGLINAELIDNYHRDFQLIIIGVPDIPDENILNTIALIAKYWKVKFEPSQVVNAYRMRLANDQSRPIIVLFNSVFYFTQNCRNAVLYFTKVSES